MDSSLIKMEKSPYQTGIVSGAFSSTDVDKSGAFIAPQPKMESRKPHSVCHRWLQHQDEQGKVLYVQYTARDISKRKEAEEKIKQALRSEKALNEELSRANEELDKLVYSWICYRSRCLFSNNQ